MKMGWSSAGVGIHPWSRCLPCVVILLVDRPPARCSCLNLVPTLRLETYMGGEGGPTRAPPLNVIINMQEGRIQRLLLYKSLVPLTYTSHYRACRFLVRKEVSYILCKLTRYDSWNYRQNKQKQNASCLRYS